jgi:excisionase family DNA binding protein
MDDTLTITEASERFAVSPSAIRRLISGNQLKATKDNKGRQLLVADELAGIFARRAKPARAGAQVSGNSRKLSDLPTGSTTGETDRYVLSLENALERERRINDDLRHEISGLRGELLKMMSEMKALLQKEDKGLLSRWIRG